MNRNLLLLLPLLLAGLFTSGRALALAEDRDQPISLKADRLEIDQKSGVARYEGDVEMEQGSLRITAARIVIRRKGNEVTQVEAEGTPVKIHQRPAAGREETRAEARRVEYDLKAATVRLTGQAHIWQNGSEFSGETILYDSQHGVVRASGGEQKDDKKKERVEVILQPRKESAP